VYIPSAFKVTEPVCLKNFIQTYSFATLFTMAGDAPFATHLPFLLEPENGEHGTLLGHVARANPHWQAFDGTREALVVFQGPHAYISPTWYNSIAVPTWNYAAVHVYGRPRIVEDISVVTALLDRLVRVYESGFEKPWDGVLPQEFKQGLLRAIVAFEIPITRIEGKFKLSQNRSAEDQAGMLSKLEASQFAESRALASFIENLARESRPDSVP